ncbi:MAG: hypothetical protein Kow00129_09510 [Thermoleophilia bacterium]
MNHLERIVAAITKQKPDRVPVTPLSINRSLRVLGYTTRTVLYDPEKMAAGKIAAAEVFDDDAVVAGTDLFVESEVLGSKVEVYEHVPVVVDYAIKEKSDLAKLRVPEAAEAGRMPVVTREIELLKQHYGDTTVVVPVTCGPLTMASQLFGPEQLLIEMIEDPEWVHRLLRICTDTALLYWRAIIDAGAHAIVALEPLSSGTIISPEQYGEFVAPYCRELFELANEHQRVPVNHVCGDTEPLIDQMASIGSPLLQLDYPISMKRAKELVGDQVCIAGNLNPVEYMLYKSPAEIYWKCREIIAEAAGGSGFILGAGCDLNPRTPTENILAMVQAAKDTVYNDDLTVEFVRESYLPPEVKAPRKTAVAA